MSQGGKASAAGGVPSGGAISMGGVPAGSGGVLAVAGAAGAPTGCGFAPGQGAGAPLESPIGGKSDFGNPGWGDSWFLTGCKSIVDGGTCSIATECPNSGLITEERFPIGGLPGQHYKVAFRFSAVVEAKEYSGGKRDGTLQPALPYDGIWDSFYRDGVPLPTERNAWKLTVYDHNGQEARHYYMNAFPVDAGLILEGTTFVVQYKKSIVVLGGGTISHTVQAPACRANDNCTFDPLGAGGEGGKIDCGSSRHLPAPDNTSMVAAQYMDAEDKQIKTSPQLSPAYPNNSLAQPWHSQVGKLTVLAIECTNDPVSADYPDPP